MSNAQEPVAVVVAANDARMDLRIVRRVPMLYSGGADIATDRPAHVRAGSGLAWVGDRLAVVQDDANFLALIDVRTGLADSVTLPVGHNGLRQFDDVRGNKLFKNDFESLVAIQPEDGAQACLMLIGSGSTSRREVIAIVANVGSQSPTVRVVNVPEFYKGLRGCYQFAGSELNVEGATVVGTNLRLFNRGNGAPRDGIRAVNATCDVSLSELIRHIDNPEQTAAPAPELVQQFDLGKISGTTLSFTDALSSTSSWLVRAGLLESDAAAVIYSAAAEASPDAVRDGEVLGSVIGIITNAEGKLSARSAVVRADDGEVARIKVEGIALGADPGQLFAVVDSDDHGVPSELYELRLVTHGPSLN